MKRVRGELNEGCLFTVLVVEGSGKLMRSLPRVGWMTYMKVAFSIIGMTVGAA